MPFVMSLDKSMLDTPSYPIALEGRDSNPRSPGLGEVVADELTDSGRPPDEAPRIMASAGWPEDSAPKMARITSSSPRRPVSPGSGHRSPHFPSSTVSSSIA